MVLEFGLLKSGLFNESELTGEGLGTDTQQTVVRNVYGTPTNLAFNNIRYDATPGDAGLICHSPLIWVNVNNASSRRTTDGGMTWANCAVDIALVMANATVCRANKAKAFAWRGDTANTGAYTTDSGNNWTAFAVAPAILTYIMDGDFPTEGIAVCCGIDASGPGICRSTNGGANWGSAATGPATHCNLISMWDASTGYAIDDSANIWKTTDGGLNWTDTTHNVGIAPGVDPGRQTMITTSATTMVYVQTVTTYICQYYDNTAGTVTSKCATYPVQNDQYTILSNLTRTTNGNTYFAMYSSYVTGTGTWFSAVCILWKSLDNGYTWVAQPLPMVRGNNTSGVNSCTKTLLSEYDTNKLALWLMNGTVLLIDESYV